MGDACERRLVSNSNGNRRVAPTTLVGAVLIVVGILFFIGQLLGIDLGRFAWPFFVIVPGILLFFLALAREGQTGERLAMGGSAVTMVGTILLVQNTFDYFQSWAYAWALVVPTSVGVGQIIYGSIKNLEAMRATGIRWAVIGIIIFLVFVVFFELVIGFSGGGIGLGGLGWAVLLIVLGVLLLVGKYVLDRLRP